MRPRHSALPLTTTVAVMRHREHGKHLIGGLLTDSVHDCHGRQCVACRQVREAWLILFIKFLLLCSPAVLESSILIHRQRVSLGPAWISSNKATPIQSFQIVPSPGN